MNTDTFIKTLVAHVPVDQQEENHRGQIMQFVLSHAHSWWMRATVEGHVTGSAWILNQANTHALLLHHQKLNRWVQPGGHLDNTEATPAAGALREAIEETGMPHLVLASEALFDIDIHAIPARTGNTGVERSEPQHLHYDVRYLIIASDQRVTISEESLDAKWMSLEELALPSCERSIARMAEKSLRKNL